MVRKASRVLQAVRDVLVLGGAIIYLSTAWGMWNQEPVHFLLAGFAIGFGVLSLINLVLVAKNVRRRTFYFVNTILQLIPSFILAGLLPHVGIVFFVLNIATLISLREKQEAKKI